jgi:hypothetical protein
MSTSHPTHAANPALDRPADGPGDAAAPTPPANLDHGWRAALPAQLRDNLWLQWGLAILLGCWFFIVLPTEPLYYENQNTKFLHGLAMVGVGHLDRDWTANTTDVMPVFTGIVYLLHGPLPAWSVYIVQILLVAVFLQGVVWIAHYAAGRGAWRPSFLFMVAMVAVAFHFANGGVRIWGGVAKQYLLGPALEPQSFGVLFLLAITLFLRRRTEAAFWLAAISAIIHPGYVVPAGTLMLAFLYAAYQDQDRSRRPRHWVVATSLAAAVGSLLYLGLMILPSDWESWSRATEILAKTRIPGHAIPAEWFDIDAALKLIACSLALWLSRRRPDLFRLIAACFIPAVGLTLLAALLDSNELGMISPWRISVYLVPLCLAVLVGHLTAAALHAFEDSMDLGRDALKALAATITIFAVAVTTRGIGQMVELYGDDRLPDHARFMQAEDSGDDLYLADPFNMDIRLQSGMPELVSWKSHPYRDREVLEWHDRVQAAKRVYRRDHVDCDALDRVIADYGVTHILVERPEQAMTCAGSELIFEGERSRIYRLAG